ncbi:hypothetical protein MSI_06970 [Treponema sp. JC4]|nr:hypothetical protein MSI_06970 [Treponema sp. JC4]
MSIYLGFILSNSVTQDEWEEVYEKTLFLADKLGLADWDRFYYKGIRHYGYCKVREQSNKDFGKIERYWKACADYKHLRTSEYFRLNRELPENHYDKNAGPAILNINNYFSQKYKSTTKKEPLRKETESMAKILQDLYLAIFCFMESRLKEKIFIYGDISYRDCEIAVDMVNKYLEEPIGLPAICNIERLYEIVNPLNITDVEKLHLMENAYLGNINLKYKRFIEQHFDKKSISEFWTNRFKDYDVKDPEFKEKLTMYFTYGFDFKDLFSYINLKETKEEYTKFFDLVIKAGMHKDRFKELGLVRNPENNKVKGFDDEFYSSLFGAESKTAIRNYTFDDLVTEFNKYFGSKIDVRKILEEKIIEEDDESFITRFKEFVNKPCSFDEEEEKYDICYPFLIMHYQKGDTMSPYIQQCINDALSCVDEALSSEEFKQLEKKEITEQIYDLIDMRPHFPVRDIDWHHAIDYFYTHSDAIRRYFPIFKMKVEDYFSATREISRTLFMNDEFFEYCKNLYCK